MLSTITACFLKGVMLFLNLYSWLIVIDVTYALFTKPKDKNSRPMQVLRNMTDPVNNVFRRMLRRHGVVNMPVDISPLLSLIAIWVIYQLFNLFFKRFYKPF
ncbi:MAG: YggT family protein [Caldicoprobacterales bacterium]|nr:YggT family protein [Clostridiales bacterium]